MPVGARPAGYGLTVAVNVTVWPTRAGLGDDVSAVGVSSCGQGTCYLGQMPPVAGRRHGICL
jgi:hypothetical protein